MSRAPLVHPWRAAWTGSSGDGIDGEYVAGSNVLKRESKGRGEKGAYVDGGGREGKDDVQGIDELDATVFGE